MKLFRFACVSVLFCASLFAQTPTTPAFEVASIKPAPPIQSLAADIQSGKLRLGMKVDGARVDMSFMSLTALLAAAYKVKAYQIVGPDWLAAQMFEIHAKLPEGASKDQVPEMLQTLLAERFKLALHRENREHPVYALIVSKNGSKLKEAPADAEAPAPAEDTAKAPSAKGSAAKGELLSVDTPDGQVKIKQEGRGMVVSGGRTGQMRMTMGENGAMRMEMSKIKMTEFAELLSQLVDRQVVDMTELKGSYQVAMDIPMEELVNLARRIMPNMALGAGGAGALGGAAPANGLSGIAASDPSGGAIFQAVQQLGLKLDSRKVPVDTLIIDHIEKDPTEN